MLVNIIDGKAEGFLTVEEAAEKFRVDGQTIRRWCQRDDFKKWVFYIRGTGGNHFYYISEKAERPIRDYSKQANGHIKQPSPYDFYTNIRMELRKLFFVPEDEDISDTYLQTIISKVLTERQIRILELFYGKSWTLEKIGKEYGLTKERIRQIKKYALRKIKGGIYWEKREAARVYSMPEFKTRKTINELNLSIRATNCLLRTGIDSIDELLVCTPDEIIRIRNLGRRTYNEILDKVHEHGYLFDWECKEAD